MLAGLAKAELAEQVGKIDRLRFIDREFQKSDAAAPRFRLQNIWRSLRSFGRKLILQQDQRPQPVGGGARRRAGAELIVEDFERERPGIAGGDDGFHEIEYRQIALAGEAAEVPAPGKDVEAEFWRIRQLNQKNPVCWNRLNGGRRKCRAQAMKAVG